MRHQVKGRHLNRTAEHRRALYRNLVAALFEHGRIRTTDAKAREVRPLAERMITLGKRGDLHARRQALRVVGTGTALERLFGPIAQRFADRPGGYTRMVKAGRRHGDGAQVAYLELLDEAPRVVRGPASGKDEEEAGSRRTQAGRGKKRGTAAKGVGATGRTEGAEEGSKKRGGGSRKAAKAAKAAAAGESGSAGPSSGSRLKAAASKEISKKAGGSTKTGGSRGAKAASEPADRKGARKGP